MGDARRKEIQPHSRCNCVQVVLKTYSWLTSGQLYFAVVSDGPNLVHQRRMAFSSNGGNYPVVQSVHAFVRDPLRVVEAAKMSSAGIRMPTGTKNMLCRIKCWTESASVNKVYIWL